MVLIPETEYQALKAASSSSLSQSSSGSSQSSSGSSLLRGETPVYVPSQISRNVKKKKKAKRKRTDEDLRSSAIELTQKLGKQIRQRAQEKSHLFKPGLNISDHIPPIYQAKAKLLLTELANAGIKYTDNKELVLNTGEIVSHSNIIDLVKEALVSSRANTPKPIGWNEFVNNIATSTVPKSLLKAKTRRELERLPRLEEEIQPPWEYY